MELLFDLSEEDTSTIYVWIEPVYVRGRFEFVQGCRGRKSGVGQLDGLFRRSKNDIRQKGTQLMNFE